MHNRNCFYVVVLMMSLVSRQPGFAKEGVIRAGIVGCDTSHVIAFTKLINDPKATGPFADVEVTAAFPGGSPDIPDSRDRLPKYVKQLRDQGIKIVDSLEELADACDAIMIESVDGRPHLKQFRAVAKGKPVFVDKPAAASLADLLTIFRVADETQTPVYSSSSLRFVKEVQEVQAAVAEKDKSIGELLGCETSSPMSMQRFHPDLFWYGIHGVEPLFAIMGPGCQTVSRTDSPLSTVVVGKWKDGRLGSYRGIKKGYYYSFSAFGTKGVTQRTGFSGYDPAVTAMCEFFKTRKPPVSRQETIEIYAFMEAADESKKQGGKPVPLIEIIDRAQRVAGITPTSVEGDK
jgi:predicted dehydrogenase